MRGWLNSCSSCVRHGCFLWTCTHDRYTQYNLVCMLSSCRCMAFNAVCRSVISCDSRGLIEYWDTMTYSSPVKRTDENSVGTVDFEYKTDTDLYALAKVCIVWVYTFIERLLSYAPFRVRGLGIHIRVQLPIYLDKHNY